MRIQIKAAVTLALAFAGLNHAAAKEVDCSGNNLMTQLHESDPAAAKAIAKSASQVPNGKGLLWKITKDGVAPSYVFGTMHLSDPRLLDLPQKVKTAFDASPVLALEITEILDPVSMGQKAIGLMKYTSYLDGSSLADKMTPEQVAIVKARLENDIGLPWSVGQKLRPWTIMGTIALPACEFARKRAGKPFLDMALGQRAEQAGKTIVALETMESQMKIMASLPEPMMVQAMVDTAKMADQLSDVFETMTQLYLDGETGMIWAMMKHLTPQGMSPDTLATGYSEFQRVVVDERNVTMADESEKLIRKGGAFIAVGALHLPGETGILNILAQRGYQISVE